MNKIYVVTMYRWGDREKHSYVHGAYTDEAVAIEQAYKEQEYRGGNKYFPEVIAFEPNTPIENNIHGIIVLGLK